LAENPNNPPGANLVWKDKPTIMPLVMIWGIVSIILIVVLVTVEWYFGNNGLGAGIPSSVPAAGSAFPYPIEIVTTFVILVFYAAKVVQLSFIRWRNRCELYDDGLYVNRGILNLENAFLSPMAFSDARLYRSLWQRLIGMGTIVVEANDGRRFTLSYVRNPLNVQQLIRNTMARPRVRF
jgi:hypothetical protein